MTKLSLTAGVVAAALATGTSALAADLDYHRGSTDRYSSAYEDPRYRDLYAPEPRGYSYEYRAEPPPPVPPAFVFRHNEPPRHYDHRYSDYRHGDRRHSSYCVPREEAKRRLINDGWRDFHDLELRDDVARVRARRPNGDLYDLKVDRCSGEIVHSNFLQRGYGPYAYDNGPSRWERTY